MSRTAIARPRRRGLVVLAGLACAVGVAGLVQAPAHAVPAGKTAGLTGTDTRPFEPGEDAVGTDITAPRSNAPSHVPSKDIPRPATLPVAAAASAKAAEGLSLKDQRNAADGNSFSLEPPDQGLCVSDSQVVEGINDVFAIHDKATGVRSAPESYAPFFNNGMVEIDRSDPANPVFGAFMSDPKCYWDPALHRFFMTILQLGTDPKTGDFDNTSFEDIAVSRTATPGTSAADWHLYKLDVANNGLADLSSADGVPVATTSTGKLVSHAGCPCLGDQPLIGADANGFYVTTNEFSIDGPQFNGAQIYAFDKAALAAGTLKVQRIETDGPAGLPLAEGTAYSIQPATSPVADEWSNADQGTEYALSALEFTGGFDNRIARWTLTNTSSLTTAIPDVHLDKTIVASEVYGAPPAVQQKPGPYPLGQSLKDKLNLLNSNDDRMNQVVFSGGRLWSGVNTAVKTPNGPSSGGIAYFVVDAADARMSNQGYVAVNGNSVMFPAIGVAAGGDRAAMVFTLAGPDFFPSTGFVSLTSTGAVAGAVQVYAAGTKPADGSSGYPQFGNNGVERWGDYSAAVADGDGVIWMATEYIPGTFGFIPPSTAPPSYSSNWGTAIGKI